MPEEFGCPNGTFNDETGLTSEAECKYCPQGKRIFFFLIDMYEMLTVL